MMPHRLNYLDACRGFAALAVVLYHAGGAFAADKYFGVQLYADIFVFGRAGVDFFFALSGFIITYMHFAEFGQPQRLSPYLVRRFLRIYPIYWIIFGVALFLCWLIPAFNSYIPDIGPLLKALFLIPQDPASVGGTGAPIIIVAWSLHYELIFYVVFAVFIVSRPLGAMGLVAIAVFAAGAMLFDFENPLPFGYLRFDFFVIFLFGSMAALLFQYLGPIRSTVILVLGLLGLCGVITYEIHAALSDQHGWLGQHLTIAYGLTSTVIIFALANLEWNASRSVPWLFRELGAASYALYLIHFLAISAVAKLFVLGPDTAIWTATAFVLTVLICVVSAIGFHNLIEKPLLRALRAPARARVDALAPGHHGLLMGSRVGNFPK